MKKSIVVLLCILMLAIGVTASNTVNAILGTDIKVSLEGKALSLKDAKGNQIYPLVFNGTTYLPVRAVAENLGLNVGWDNNTKTVSLSKGTTAKQKDVYEIGDWWEVPGQWRLKVESVNFIDSNSDDTTNEFVLIKYSFENLGYVEQFSPIEGLIMSPSTVLDSNKKVGKYEFSFDANSAQHTPIGAIMENASVYYKLPSKNNKTITIIFSERTGEENSQIKKATFVVPVNR